jgi:tricarballylate dehydrogenase
VESFDVIVVGGGNAALCAALSAKETAKRVLVLERAPMEEAGGNSRFTAGLLRIVYNGAQDLAQLIELSKEELERTDFGTYTAGQFLDDMARVTEYRCDPDLTEILVKESFPTALWMRNKGLRFTAAWGRQAFKIDGRFKFWGGLTLEAIGGGPGLVESLTQIAKKNGVEIWYAARAVSLLADDAGVHGVVVKRAGKTIEVKANAVVLAAGGFQANPEWRTRYLGPLWELAKVRGTRFNTGDAIRMALDIGAAPVGNWSGCHAVAWERNAPEFGDLAVGDQFQKHSYPWGIYINAEGRRFVDEGADFRNYTYAKYGRVILNQPGQFAWQIFDAKVKGQLRDEYRIKQVTKVTANTLEELVKKLDDVDADAALREIKAYNAAVRTDVPFNPNVKDGRCTTGLAVNKSNWANTLDTPPFEAYAVTCGITFSFGGLRINTDAQVISTDGETIPGLYAAGELVGGIFYFNYPGGSGLTNGAVFGKIAGASAAKQALPRVIEAASRQVSR